MKDVSSTTSHRSGEDELSVQLPEDEPVITDQVAVVLLRLIRNALPKRIDENEQQEKKP